MPAAQMSCHSAPSYLQLVGTSHPRAPSRRKRYTHICRVGNLQRLFSSSCQRIVPSRGPTRRFLAITLAFFASSDSNSIGIDRRNGASDTPWPIAYNSASANGNASFSLRPSSANHVAPMDSQHR